MTYWTIYPSTEEEFLEHQPSPSQRYVVVSRSRENNWDKPPLDDIMIDSLCH